MPEGCFVSCGRERALARRIPARLAPPVRNNAARGLRRTHFKISAKPRSAATKNAPYYSRLRAKASAREPQQKARRDAQHQHRRAEFPAAEHAPRKIGRASCRERVE